MNDTKFNCPEEEVVSRLDQSRRLIAKNLVGHIQKRRNIHIAKWIQIKYKLPEVAYISILQSLENLVAQNTPDSKIIVTLVKNIEEYTSSKIEHKEIISNFYNFEKIANSETQKNLRHRFVLLQNLNEKVSTLTGKL